jgi:hypothetical protein
MRYLLTTGCGLVLLTLIANAQPEADTLPKLTAEEEKRLEPYLTKDFNLTAALEMRDELTGFGTFFGTIWRIEPDGAWTITRILEKKPILIGEGKLSKKQIYELSKRLYVYDPLSLPNLGKPFVNPHVISSSFGPKTSEFTLGVDQKLALTRLEDVLKPVTDLGPYVTGKGVQVGTVIQPLEPATRYAGIQWAIRGLIQPNLGVNLMLPERLKQLGHPE